MEVGHIDRVNYSALGAWTRWKWGRAS